MAIFNKIYLIETLIKNRLLKFDNEPSNLYKYLLKVYKPNDFNNITKDSINKVLESKTNGNLQKEWIGYMESWKDNDDKYNSIIDSKVQYLKGLNIVKIWEDYGGTELGIDIDSKKIFCFDHDYGLINNTISINQAVSLKEN